MAAIVRIDALRKDGTVRDVDQLMDNVAIERLEISDRAYKALHAAGIKTVGQIRALSDAELFRIPDFGKGALFEVRNKTQSHMLESQLSTARDEAARLLAVRGELKQLEIIIDRLMGKLGAAADAYRAIKGHSERLAVTDAPRRIYVTSYPASNSGS